MMTKVKMPMQQKNKQKRKRKCTPNIHQLSFILYNQLSQYMLLLESESKDQARSQVKIQRFLVRTLDNTRTHP